MRKGRKETNKKREKKIKKARKEGKWILGR